MHPARCQGPRAAGPQGSEARSQVPVSLGTGTAALAVPSLASQVGSQTTAAPDVGGGLGARLDLGCLGDRPASPCRPCALSGILGGLKLHSVPKGPCRMRPEGRVTKPGTPGTSERDWCLLSLWLLFLRHKPERTRCRSGWRLFQTLWVKGLWGARSPGRARLPTALAPAPGCPGAGTPSLWTVL